MAKKRIAVKSSIEYVMDNLEKLHREGKIYSLSKHEKLIASEHEYIYVAFKIPINKR